LRVGGPEARDPVGDIASLSRRVLGTVPIVYLVQAALAQLTPAWGFRELLDIDDAALLELLLGDIREVFAEREANKVDPADRISSADLAEALAEIEGRPWAEYGKNDKPITQNKLARLLKQLKIVPDSVRIDEKRTPKGYYLRQFEEAFELPLQGATWARAVEVMERYDLKSYDAIHIATAQERGLLDCATMDRDFEAIHALTLWLARDDRPPLV